VRYGRRQVVQGAGAVGLGLLVGCGRLPWQTPSVPKVYRIGVLDAGGRASSDLRRDAFLQGLHEFGYTEGENILIDYRHADGRLAPLPTLATELVRLPVDVIVTATAPAISAAKDATSTIPIVMANSPDPVTAGLVASLARPGGNVTGLTDMAVGLSAKRLELLKAAVPAASRVAILWQSGNPGNELILSETQDAARALGVDLEPLGVREPNEFEAAFETLSSKGVDAIIVAQGPLVTQGRRIVELATKSGLPVMYPGRGLVEVGGLMAYGPSAPGNWRRAAYYVDRILKGTKPADLPVEQPMTFDFVINLQTAQALGLTIPHHVLLQATEVIQ
jgi:putative tryptophan/tyrosine transport system substrate-binding protein